MCDVALDPYTSHGHDGLIKSNTIVNDETIEVLINQSLLQAEMGCDVLAPSDMMDGRIGKIRKALDKENFKQVQILSYAAKYASSFYGPFRDAVGSNKFLKGDKKTYQMDFRNSDEALREISLDIKEGADMVMVKPGMPYLDIIKGIKDKFKIPVFAYQVSGEYSMLSNAVEKKIINKNAIFENLMSFKRAGANAIVTYYADRLNEILEGIKKLQKLNFKNIKVNAVLLKGVNDKEEDFKSWANFIKNNQIDFRYIELMQTGDNLDYFNKYHVSANKFTDYLNNNNWVIQTFGKDAGPSKNYINAEYKGKFGVIAPYSKDFCKSCNRLRITAKGDLRLCLFGNTGINIRHLMQRDDQTEELKDLILKQLNYKKESHYLEIGETGLTKNLSTTGG